MFDVNIYADATKAMKSADTTAENKATPWARLTLRALLDGALTLATMDQVLINAYKPKTASGKDGKTRGSLPDSPKKRANVMAYIFENKDVGEVRAIVDAFAADQKDAPRTIAALHKAVKAAVAAAASEVIGDDDSEGETETVNQTEAPAPVPASIAIVSMAEGLIAALAAAPTGDIEAAQGALVALMDAIGDASARLAGVTEGDAQAA